MDIQKSIDNWKFSFPEKNGKEKLKELILYIAEICFDDPTFGATKLNKILYYSDFDSYRMYNDPVTGVEYMRLENGPVPKYMKPIQNEMIEKGRIKIKEQDFHDYRQKRTIAFDKPNLDILSSRDISIVDKYIQMFWGKTATEVSEISHGISWEIARDGQSIPYQAVFLEKPTLTEDDIVRARELAYEYGWNS